MEGRGVRLCPPNSVVSFLYGYNYTRNRKRLPEAPLWRCMRFLEWCCSEGSQKDFFLQAGKRLMIVWIGGGGSGGSGEYDCAHQTALYNTRNKKCLPESPLLLLVLFFRGRGSQGGKSRDHVRFRRQFYYNMSLFVLFPSVQ